MGRTFWQCTSSRPGLIFYKYPCVQPVNKFFILFFRSFILSLYTWSCWLFIPFLRFCIEFVASITSFIRHNLDSFHHFLSVNLHSSHSSIYIAACTGVILFSVSVIIEISIEVFLYFVYFSIHFTPLFVCFSFISLSLVHAFFRSSYAIKGSIPLYVHRYSLYLIINFWHILFKFYAIKISRFSNYCCHIFLDIQFCFQLNWTQISFKFS
jgi:hypothetical protein